jgi:hypothetical protein
VQQVRSFEKLNDTLQLIRRELTAIIGVEASFHEANDVVMALKGIRTIGNTFNVIQQALIRYMALSAAKLFELPSRRSKDVASVPALMEHLKRPDLVRLLVTGDRDYLPSGGKRNEAERARTEEALEKAFKAYEAIEDVGRLAPVRAQLDDFRNVHLAHILDKKLEEGSIRLGDIFELLKLAREIAEHLATAFYGGELDFEIIEKDHRRSAKLFWDPALKAVVDAPEDDEFAMGDEAI